MKKWEELPENMRTPEVKDYYNILIKKKFSLALKRLFDISVSFILLLFLLPVFLLIAVAVKTDSEGPVFYRQTRVTRYGEEFRIFKFRTMVTDADKGSLLTVSNDARVTRVGKVLRKYKIDELSQLIDVFRGKMSFVGPRPEVPKYVCKYSDEMMATLLLPAGITSEASIYYKDESDLLDSTDDPESVYINEILPDKMKYNLSSLRSFSFFSELKIMFLTVKAVVQKEKNDKIIKT